MFRRSKDDSTFSTTPIQEDSWLAKLKPSKPPPAPAKWPNPQDSVGKYCCNIDGFIFWEVKDPGRAKLASLEAEVQRFLNEHNEHWKERESCNLSFSIFMVGRHETASSPTVVIISTNKKSRQKVVATLQSNGILDKYEGVLLAGSSRHPRLPNSGPPKYIALDAGDGSPPQFPSGTAVYFKKLEYLESPGGAVPIYIPVNAVLSEGPSPFRRATLGGFFELTRKDGTKTTTVGMTVAHAFQPLDWNVDMSDQSEGSDEDVFEFEFDGPTPDSIFGGESSNAHVSKAASSHSFKPFSSQPSSKLQIVTEDRTELSQLGVLIQTSLETRPGLDWALVEITATDLRITNAMQTGLRSVNPRLEFSTTKRDIRVLALTTGAGPNREGTGIMSGFSTFLKMEHSDKFEEVKTVKLNALSYGDSGTWVVEADSLKLCGHIVAGDLSTTVAYIIPAETSFAHVEQVLGRRIEFPEPGRRFFEYSTHQMHSARDKKEGQQYSSTAGGKAVEEKRKSRDIPPLPREWGVDVPMAGTGNFQQKEKSSDLTDIGSEKARSTTFQSSDISTDTPHASIPSNMATGGWEDRLRERDRDRRARQRAARTNEYFVPKEGIDREVIAADICRYLGNDALVRPGNYENPQTRQIQQGYFITAYRNLTTAMIADLKADSERWEVERRATAQRGQPSGISFSDSDGIVRRSNTPIVEYRTSTTHISRQYYGPTSEAASAVPLGYQQPASTGQVYDSSAQGGYAQPSYAQPSSGYQQAGGYAPQDSSNYYVAGGNFGAPETTLAARVPVTQSLLPRSDFQSATYSTSYPQQQDSRTMYYSQQPAVVAPPSTQSSTQPTDPYYGRAAPYNSQDPHDSRMYQDSSAYSQIPVTAAPAAAPATSSSSSRREREAESERRRDDRQRRRR